MIYLWYPVQTPHAFCFFSYRLADHPQLSAEFRKHLNRLPQSLNTSQSRALYRRLIDTYGTHYIHQVREMCRMLPVKDRFTTDSLSFFMSSFDENGRRG